MRAPFTARWESTYLCNLLCKHCYTTSGGARDVEFDLRTNEVKRVLDDLGELGIITFQVEGGEPLMRRDIFECLAYASQRIPNILLETNGTLMTDEKAKRITEANVSSVTVSLDSARPEAHDDLRGQSGAFNKALRALAILQHNHVPVAVRTVVTRENYREIDDFALLLRRLRIKKWLVTRFFPCGRGEENLRLLASPHQLRWFVNKCTALRESHQGELDLNLDETFVGCGSDPGLNVSQLMHDVSVCPAGQTICEITARGDVIPCPYIRWEVMGNVRNNSFDEIWERMADFELARPGDVGSCTSCRHYRNDCIGGCRAAAYFATGSLLGPDLIGCDLLADKFGDPLKPENASSNPL